MCRRSPSMTASPTKCPRSWRARRRRHGPGTARRSKGTWIRHRRGRGLRRIARCDRSRRGRGAAACSTRPCSQSLRWVATHYVAPLSTVLSRCAPPNLPKKKARATRTSEIGRRTARSVGGAAGQRWPNPARIPPDRGALRWVVSAMAPVLRGGKNVIVTAPTVVEAHAAAERLRAVFGERVLTATSDDPPIDRTASWTQIATPTASVVVGTREVAFWGAGAIGMAVVLEEGRRGYKSPQTPTYHVRDVLRRRSVIERFALLLTGAVPTSEAMSAGIEIVRSRPTHLAARGDRRSDDRDRVSWNDW